MLQPNQRRWRWFAGLAVVTAVSVILRVHNLGSNSYWLDEAISVLIARLPVPLILSNAGESSHPAMYYLLLHYWPRGGGAEAWTRGLSVFWGFLTVPATYALGFHLFNRRVGLLASLLLAVAPFHIAYSQEARMYTQLTCLGVFALVFLHRAMAGGRLGWWVATGVTMAMAVTTHLFAFLLLAAANLYALLCRRECLVRLIIISLVAMIVVAPHLIGVMDESQHELGRLRPLAGRDRPSLLYPFAAIHLLLVGYSITSRLMPVAMFCSLAAFIVALREAIRAIRRRSGQWQSLLLLSLVAGITLLGPFSVAQVHPFFLPQRTLLAALPAMVLLIAWGITEVEHRTPLPALGIGLAVVMMVSLRGHYANPDFQKPPMRHAATFVKERVDLGEAILHTSDGSYLSFLVYVDHPDHFLLAGDPDPRKAEAVYRALGGQLAGKGDLVGSFERLWLVVALEHSFDFQREAVAWYTDRYHLLERYEIGGIAVLLLDLTLTELNRPESAPGSQKEVVRASKSTLGRYLTVAVPNHDSDQACAIGP